MRKTLLVILCVVCNIFYSRSQDFKKTEKTLTVADGLSGRHINSTFVDRQNRVWILADNQLGQYESEKVKNTTLSADFSNRGFNHVVQDRLNNLWISENVEWYLPFNTVRTLVFNPKTKQVVLVEKYIGQKLPIHSILTDSRQNIFISTKDGKVYQFDVVKKSLNLIYSIGNKPLKLLYIGVKGIVVGCEKDFQTDQKLIYLNHQGKMLKEMVFVGSEFVRSVVETENDLLVLSYGKQMAFIKSVFSGKQVGFSNTQASFLWNIFYDKAKQLLVLSESNSILFINKDLTTVTREKFDFLLHDIFIDNANNYFISSNNGVHIVNFSKNRIQNYLKNNEPDKVNENYSCRGILKLDEANLIVNTNRQRQLVNLKTGATKALHNFKNENGKNYQFVLSILKDNDSDLLFGEDALVKTNLKTGKDEILCSPDSTKIWAIEDYRSGVLLGLEKKGIIYFDKKTRKGQVFDKPSEVFANAIVYDFYIWQNDIYIAAENGFYRFTDQKDLRRFRFSAEGKIQRACFHIFDDSKKTNNLLIATANGIWYFDFKTERLSPFIQDKNFNDKKFLSVYRTQNGVWASSEEGVWHFDDNGKLLKIYTEADGLTSNECNRLAHYQDQNGNLYFGGINGLNILNPMDFSKQNEDNYRLMIDSIYTYSDDKISQSLGDFTQKTLNLSRNEQSVALVLSYEDFKYHCPKQYYYRTDKSINNDWQLLTDHRFILDNIEHGATNIEFRVVSCNDYLNAQTIRLTIYRDLPLYMKWYFWILVVVFLAIIVWVAIKISNHQLKTRNELLQRKVDEQTQSLRESLELKETILGILVHDVRYPVQSFYDISKKLEFLIKRQDFDRLNLLGKETESRSRKVLWLIDELVYWVKSTNKNWQANREEKILGSVVRQIFESYQDELKAKNLDFEISKEDILAKIDLSLMVIVLRNLIFNSIIHAQCGTTIRAEIKKTDNQRINVTFSNEFDAQAPKNEKGLGMGLSLLQPILSQSGIEIKTVIEEDIYTANLLLHYN